MTTLLAFGAGFAVGFASSAVVISVWVNKR